MWAGIWFAVSLAGVADEGSDVLETYSTVLFIVLICVFFLVIDVFRKRQRDAQIAWLQNLPFDFDLEAYLTGLGEERMSTIVTLRIVFAAEVSEYDRDTVSDAIGGAVVTEERRWKKHDLVVRSWLSTWSVASHSNHNAHVWVRACLNGVLVVHAKYPVESVSVALGT